MTENSMEIRDACINGLRPNANMPVNAPYCTRMKNLRPSDLGAIGLELIWNNAETLSGGYAGGGVEVPPVSAWPYPYLHKGPKKTLLLGDTTIKYLDLEDTQYPDAVANGTFASDTLWTKGTGWAIGSNKATHTAGTGSDLVQEQAVQTAGQKILSGYYYTLTCTISCATSLAGTLEVYLGTNLIGTVSTIGDKTYTGFAYGGADITFTASADFNGAVAAVTCKREAESRAVYDIASACGAAANSNTQTLNTTLSATKWAGTNWTYSGGVATHATGNTAALIQTNANQSTGNEIVEGTVYQVKLVLDNVSVGSVSVRLGNTTEGDSTNPLLLAPVSQACAQDGTYWFQLKAVGATPSFQVEPTSDFVGDVTEVSCRAVTTNTIDAAGGGWQVADFGEVWVATKTTATLFSVPYLCSGEPIAINTAENDISIAAVANFHDRLIMGGLVQDAVTKLFDTAQWDVYWKAWLYSDASLSMTYEGQRMDSTVLVYGMSAGGDYAAPLLLELALLGKYAAEGFSTELATNVRDAFMKREMGFLPLPWKQPIRHIRPLGQGFVVYCGDGVSFVRYAEDGTLVQTDLLSYGIAGRNAVTGSPNEHRFIDTFGCLWSVKPDLSAQRMDYVEFLYYLATGATEVLGSYDTDQQEFYFCNATLGYISTRKGLGGTLTVLPTSLVRIGLQLYGPAVNLEDAEALFVTDTLDFGTSEQKTIQTLDFGVSAGTGFDATGTIAIPTRGLVYWREGNAATYRLRGPALLSADMLYQPIITAQQFRVGVSCAGAPLGITAQARVERISVRYKQTGKRGLRGTFQVA